MKAEKSSKIFRVLAGFLFLANSFLDVRLELTYPDRGIYWILACLLIISSVLIAIGFFARNNIIVMSGGIVWTACRIVRLLICVIGNNHLKIDGVVRFTLYLIPAVLFVVATIKKGRTARLLGIVITIFIYLQNWTEDFWGIVFFLPPLRVLVYWIIRAIPYLFAGLALSFERPEPIIKKTIQEPQNSPSLSDNVEKLTKLKALLDSGVITQEEFDAKKLEIMKL